MPRDSARSALAAADYEVLADFRHSLRKFQHDSDHNVRAAGLTPQQHQALLAIKGSYPGRSSVTVGELARAMLLKHHSAVELVGRLIKAGLVKSRKSNVDRRQVMVSLTAEGEAILRSLSRANLEVLRRAAPVLSDLLRMLERHGFGRPRRGASR